MKMGTGAAEQEIEMGTKHGNATANAKANANVRPTGPIDRRPRLCAAIRLIMHEFT